MTCDCKEHQEHIEQLRCAVKIAFAASETKWTAYARFRDSADEALLAYQEAHDLWQTALRELEEAEKANG
jgi:hypothetical protein